MAKMRISGEGRSLVQDRFPHRAPHRLAYRVIPGLEIGTDFRVRYMLEARRPEVWICKERGKLKEREAIGREHVERVPQKLIGPRSEVVEGPAFAKDLGELSDPDEIRRLTFQRIETDGSQRIGRVDDNQPV